MKNKITKVQLRKELTAKEFSLLDKIAKMYDSFDNHCWVVKQQQITPSQKGVLGSLVKKGLVYDSFADERRMDSSYTHNYFPTGQVLDAFGIYNI